MRAVRYLTLKTAADNIMKYLFIIFKDDKDLYSL